MEKKLLRRDFQVLGRFALKIFNNKLLALLNQETVGLDDKTKNYSYFVPLKLQYLHVKHNHYDFTLSSKYQQLKFSLAELLDEEEHSFKLNSLFLNIREALVVEVLETSLNYLNLTQIGQGSFSYVFRID
jgi:hypothetical protein